MKQKEVHFYLKDAKDKNSKKLTQVMCNFSYHKERLRISAKLSIAPCNWNYEKGMPKSGFADYSNFKKTLLELEDKVLAAYAHFTQQGFIPSPQSLKNQISNKNNFIRESEIKDFNEWYPEFLKEKGLEVKDITLKKYRTLIKLTKEFEDAEGYRLKFGLINESFEIHFKAFLTSGKLTSGIFQCNNTVSKYIECLKVYMQWAYKRKLHENRDFEFFRAKRDATKVINLYSNELDLLYNLNLEDNDKLCETRDKFLFQCYTGQRFSDHNGIKYNEITTDTSGIKIWVVFQKKGNRTEEVRVPVLGRALEILERQKGKHGEYVFKPICNNNYNDNIRELCETAGLNEFTIKKRYSGKKVIDLSAPKHKLITSHCARRTFVTVSHQNGMDTRSIRAITGHSTTRTMDLYLGSDEKHVLQQYQKAWS